MFNRPSVVGAMCIFAFAIMQVTAGILPGTAPEASAPAADIATYFASKHDQLLAAFLVSTLGVLPFLGFAAVMVAGANTDRPSQVALALFVAASATAISVSLVGSAMGLAGIVGDADARLMQLSYRAQTVAYLLIGVPAIVIVASATFLLLRRGASQFVLIPLAVAASAGLLVTQFSVLVDHGAFSPGGAAIVLRELIFAAWLLACGWALLRPGQRSPLTRRTTATA